MPPKTTRSADRAKSAAVLQEKLEKLYASAFHDIPSFTGKSRFIDKIKRIETLSHNLAWELKVDASENAN